MTSVFTISAICDNCGNTWEQEFPRGTRISYKEDLCTFKGATFGLGLKPTYIDIHCPKCGSTIVKKVKKKKQ